MEGRGDGLLGGKGTQRGELGQREQEEKEKGKKWDYKRLLYDDAMQYQENTNASTNTKTNTNTKQVQFTPMHNNNDSAVNRTALLPCLFFFSLCPIQIMGATE